jgi:hypothetical protein
VAELETRAALSVSFLVGAGIFADRARGIEVLATPTPLERTEHLSLVVSAINQAVAAIESQLSDVALHGPGHHLGSSEQNTAQLGLLAPHAAEILKQSGVLPRWKATLKILGKPLSLGDRVCQQAGLLVDLRNELTHFKSYWGGALHRPGMLEALMAERFEVPAWVPAGRLVDDFPQRVLVASCARWAFLTATAFLDHVGDLLGPSVVDHHRSSGDFADFLPPRSR